MLGAPYTRARQSARRGPTYDRSRSRTHPRTERTAISNVDWAASSRIFRIRRFRVFDRGTTATGMGSSKICASRSVCAATVAPLFGSSFGILRLCDVVVVVWYASPSRGGCSLQRVSVLSRHCAIDQYLFIFHSRRVGVSITCVYCLCFLRTRGKTIDSNTHTHIRRAAIVCTGARSIDSLISPAENGSV